MNTYHSRKSRKRNLPIFLTENKKSAIFLTENKKEEENKPDSLMALTLDAFFSTEEGRQYLTSRFPTAIDYDYPLSACSTCGAHENCGAGVNDEQTINIIKNSFFNMFSK